MSVLGQSNILIQCYTKAVMPIGLWHTNNVLLQPVVFQEVRTFDH